MKIFKPLFFLILLGTLQSLTYAQVNLDTMVPLDEHVKVGRLENGLTYYIQHNPKPENKLELRLALKVGAMQEDVRQLGLAHFVEHMAFNGSEHFEKNELISYLQSIGVAFGSDLNAYTSFDETVYMLPIPTEEQEKLTNGFQVMRDWAGGLLLNTEDIDAERGIVVEEWRTGQGVGQRLRDAYLPVLLHESRYAERMPIGKMEVIRNAADSLVRKFYKEWYRPELMAVVAVGDVPTEKVEGLIKEYFSDLENPENAPDREYYDVPGHEENFVKIITDEEAPGIQVQLYYKHKAKPSVNYGDYKGRILRTMFGGMITQRLDEIRQQADAPFIFAGARYGNLVKPLDFFTISGVVGPGKLKEGLLSFITENQRVVDHGFTQSELDRVKRSLLNSAEKSFKEKDKVESRTLVGRYVSHFLNQSFADGPENRYRFYQEIIPEITLEEVNGLADELIRNDNIVLIVSAPEKDKESLPKEEELLTVLENAVDIQTEPYKEELLREELMLSKPMKGEVIDQAYHEKVNVTTVTLANGMKVYFKPTDYKNNEIIFTANSKGGTSLYPLEDHYSANYSGTAINVMGIGDFSPSQLKKVLAGRNVQVTPNISTYSERITGATTPGDFEMTLQLIHLYFTSPRMDQSLWEVFIANQKNQLESASVNPDFQFNKRVNEIISNGNPRGKGIYTAGQLDTISLNKSVQIYKERFANAADFNVLFTGNIDIEEMLPLVTQYLGSLPGDPSKRENFVDLGLTPPQDRKETIKVGVDEKSQVILYFSGETAYNLAKSQQLSYLGEILTIKLIETLREEIGGVYGVGARGSLSRIPEERFSFSVSFPCGPEAVEKLTAAVWEQIRKIQEEGPDEVDLAKVRETKRLDLEENLKRNGFWHGQLNAAINGGLPLDTVLGAEGRVLGVSALEVKQAANEYLQKPYLLQITKYPANFEE